MPATETETATATTAATTMATTMSGTAVETVSSVTLVASPSILSGDSATTTTTTLSTLSSTKRALDCPEILYAIGECIPLFERNTASQYYTFHPQTLLKCCLVSKVWHEVLSPLLWRVDDAVTMSKVPREMIVKNSRYVRTYFGYRNYSASSYTQLRRLTLMERARNTKEEIMSILGANKQLRMLSLSKNYIFRNTSSQKQQKLETNAATENDQDTDQDNVQSPTNPLGHLQTTLEELCLQSMDLEQMDLYNLVRSVAKGCLRTLIIDRLQGTMDLRDVVFVSLTRLHLWLDDKLTIGLHEIIGRSPQLEHLEINGNNDVNRRYPLDLVGHVLRGTRPEETSSEKTSRIRAGKPEPRQWPRPPLKTLRINGSHNLVVQNGSGTERGNDPQLLDLIRACSGTTVHSLTGKPFSSSLRELDLILWVVDSPARQAIATLGPTLEILKIRTMYYQMDIPSQKVEEQGRVLRRILQSCPRLKEFEFLDQLVSTNVTVFMEGLIGERGVDVDNNNSGSLETTTATATATTAPNNENGDQEAAGVPKANPQQQANEDEIRPLECPELVSLVLKSRKLHQHPNKTVEEEEKWFLDENHSNSNGSGSAWRMPKQMWDCSIDDGTTFLLNAEWSSFELFEDVVQDIGRPSEGDELLRRFFRHFSPSRKLQDIQLGQLCFQRV
ncbi:hypothetical protein BGX31_005026 [Mortierella sp. GBA43]|nr:hypothetical protein BGX31_005026 [Mortierella sp. GBA43]